jgi:hypothetical protein
MCNSVVDVVVRCLVAGCWMRIKRTDAVQRRFQIVVSARPLFITALLLLFFVLKSEPLG